MTSSTEPAADTRAMSAINPASDAVETEFVYVFGYESPEEREANGSVGTDFESSGVVRIRARSELAAKEWGEAVAAWYVAKLFDLTDAEIGLGWTPSNFASWIETDPDDRLRAVVARHPVISIGEHPDFELMRAALRD